MRRGKDAAARLRFGSITDRRNLRLEPELKEAAERAAADDHRSLTSLIEKLLSEYLRGRGYLPKPEAGG